MADLQALLALWRRNIRLFFRDKGQFLSAMIAPLILIVLYVTFLASVYRSSLLSMTEAWIEMDDSLMDGFIGGWMFSCLLAVSCVTVAFTCNSTMVEDRSRGVEKDFQMCPVSSGIRYLAYFLATASVTLIITLLTLGVCLVWLGFKGWYLSVQDILLSVLDVILLSLFGTALSMVVQSRLKSQGQSKAVVTIVSSMYGFLCGAYMPIAQFSDGIRNLLRWLPGTCGTGLLHLHLMRGTYEAMEKLYPVQIIDGIRDAFDGTLYFGTQAVSEPAMFLILTVSILVLCLLFLLLSRRSTRSVSRPAWQISRRSA